MNRDKSNMIGILDKKNYLEDKGVMGISYNPFTTSQMKLLENWFANQCDYFRSLEQEHSTEIYYSGMASASKLIRDKFILERFVSSLDEDISKGSSVCPICGKDSPHYHSHDEATITMTPEQQIKSLSDALMVYQLDSKRKGELIEELQKGIEKYESQAKMHKERDSPYFNGFATAENIFVAHLKRLVETYK